MFFNLGMNPHFINIHSHYSPLAYNEIVIRNAYYFLLKQPIDNQYISVGVHPWGAIKSRFNSTLEEIEKASKQANVLAIGEIGLDYLYPNQEVQKEMFLAQLQLARKLQFPVIVHCVKALEDLFTILKTYPHPTILHNFYASESLTKKFCQLPEVSFSLGKRYLHAKGEHKLYSKSIPLHRLFFETDQMRIPVQQVYEKYGLANSVSVKELSAQIWQNALTYFPKLGAQFQ